LAFEKAPLPANFDRFFAGFPRVFAAIAQDVSQIVGKVVGRGWFLAAVEPLRRIISGVRCPPNAPVTQKRCIVSR
jgi:hypothetical protein